jgi:hypothetical protein
MLEIVKNGCFQYILFGTRAIIFHEMEYSSFKDNIFVLEGEKRYKINPEELTFVDFNILFNRHKPVYNNPVQRKLDMDYLLKTFTWSNINNYSRKIEV